MDVDVSKLSDEETQRIVAARARAELERRRRASSLTFRDFIRRVMPRFRFYQHIDKLISVLQRVADGELDRVMVFMPPRHGKSETVSRLFTAYYLYRYPERWVGVNSYADALGQHAEPQRQGQLCERGRIAEKQHRRAIHAGRRARAAGCGRRVWVGRLRARGSTWG